MGEKRIDIICYSDGYDGTVSDKNDILAKFRYISYLSFDIAIIDTLLPKKEQKKITDDIDALLNGLEIGTIDETICSDFPDYKIKVFYKTDNDLPNYNPLSGWDDGWPE